LIRSDKATYEFEKEGNDCCYEKKSDIKHYNAKHPYPYLDNHMFAIEESFYENIKTLTNNSMKDNDVSMSHIQSLPNMMYCSITNYEGHENTIIFIEKQRMVDGIKQKMKRRLSKMIDLN